MRKSIVNLLYYGGISLAILGGGSSAVYFAKSGFYDSCYLKKGESLEMVCKPAWKMDIDPYEENIGLLLAGLGGFALGIAGVGYGLHKKEEKDYARG